MIIYSDSSHSSWKAPHRWSVVLPLFCSLQRLQRIHRCSQCLLQFSIFLDFPGMQCQRSRIHLPRKLAAKRQRNSKAPKVVDGSLALATVPTEKVVVTAWQWTKSSQLVWCFFLKPLVSYGFHDTLSGSRRLSQILSGSTFHESWMNSEFYDPAFSTFPKEIPSRSSLVLFLP